ncbi:hypothetical protein AKA01nite_17100 [Alkalibacterium kapii]|uniref:Uncharacterized protein n=1 Tax=Alkalibacterium kapii TaxID=426704 RepID=A0A511AV59_9LACT|nr:hypothetical protein AKA01nite_17100 [Alkalibacterium kapii]
MHFSHRNVELTKEVEREYALFTSKCRTRKSKLVRVNTLLIEKPNSRSKVSFNIYFLYQTEL